MRNFEKQKQRNFEQKSLKIRSFELKLPKKLEF